MRTFSLLSLQSRRRQLGIALLALLATAPQLCVAATARETITLCYENVDVMPWRTANGKGLNFELLNLVASQTDIHFDYRSAPWKRCLALLKSNEVAGVFAASFLADRLEWAEYPGGTVPDTAKRLHIDHFVMLRKKGTQADWDGKAFHNINGAIGFQLGYSIGDFLRAKGMQVDEGTQSPYTLVHKLLAGRLAAVAMGNSDATRVMGGPLAAELEAVPTPLLEKPYYLIFSHALVGANPQLAARIWKAIEEVRNGPAYTKIVHDAEEANRTAR
jgi:polar amino acid transport system substrate-binding protein